MNITERSAAQALSGSLGGAYLRQFGLVMLALTIVLPHFKRVPRFRLNPLSVFLIYVIFGVCSTLWSASPIATLGKSVELFTAVLIVLVTMARADREVRIQRLLYLTLLECALALCYITAGNIFDPMDFHEAIHWHASSLLFSYSWSSWLIAYNTISQLGALLSLFSLARALEKRKGSSLLMLGYFLGALFPVLTQGRTGMVSLAVGTGLIVARRFPLSSIIAIPSTLGFAYVLGAHTLFELFMRGQDEGALLSLSGRTNLWHLGWEAFIAKPWFGSGWGVGSRAAILQLFPMGSLAASDTASLHNGAIEVLLGVGLFGFAIWAWALVWSWWLAAAAYLRGETLSVSIVVPTTATFLSTGVGGWLDFFLQYFLVLTALLWLRQRQRRIKMATGRASRLMLTEGHPG